MNKSLIIGEYRILIQQADSLVFGAKCLSKNVNGDTNQTVKSLVRFCERVQTAIEVANMKLVLKTVKQVAKLYTATLATLSDEQISFNHIWLSGIEMDIKHIRQSARSLADWEG